MHDAKYFRTNAILQNELRSIRPHAAEPLLGTTQKSTSESKVRISKRILYNVLAWSPAEQFIFHFYIQVFYHAPKMNLLLNTDLVLNITHYGWTANDMMLHDVKYPVWLKLMRLDGSKIALMNKHRDWRTFTQKVLPAQISNQREKYANWKEMNGILTPVQPVEIFSDRF